MSYRCIDLALCTHVRGICLVHDDLNPSGCPAPRSGTVLDTVLGTVLHLDLSPVVRLMVSETK